MILTRMRGRRGSPKRRIPSPKPARLRRRRGRLRRAGLRSNSEPSAGRCGWVAGTDAAGSESSRSGVTWRSVGRERTVELTAAAEWETTVVPDVGFDTGSQSQVIANTSASYRLNRILTGLPFRSAGLPDVHFTGRRVSSRILIFAVKPGIGRPPLSSTSMSISL